MTSHIKYKVTQVVDIIFSRVKHVLFVLKDSSFHFKAAVQIIHVCIKLL